ncbi:MAG: DUF5753 domain-containing protein [Streptosporangiales bacterium]|jgi:DNA-binding XRE family transcriptional regulator|nr:DUF5753 domain-containing protein [Streptosporangiales bacterium]
MDTDHPLIQHFARQLERMRLDQAWTRAALASHLGAWQEGIIGHVERGRRLPTLKFARACDKVFFPNQPNAKVFENLVTDAGIPDTDDTDYFRPWVELEKEAVSFRTWEALAMPGLTQTEQYAYAVNLPWEAADNSRDTAADVSKRMKRQEIFDRKFPPSFSAIINEQVLYHCIGSAAVMAAQLQHLLDLSERPRVAVQVLPGDLGAHVGLGGAFTLAEFGGDRPGMVYMEGAETGVIARDPERFAHMSSTFDTLRSYALDVRASRDRIQKAMEEKWKD